MNRTPGEVHIYKSEGSDTAPFNMIGMCSCGWRGEVRKQGQEGNKASAKEWLDHIEKSRQ